ncbi:MAG: deoxyuridine 5'-triphosphate nucleotidohydrolase [bacterium]|nr:deoxyuridine 5'-triphosphate nucleotidohydrolase [bacterium]
MIIPDWLLRVLLPGLPDDRYQPASLDLSIEKVFVFKNQGKVHRHSKQLPEVEELEPSNGVYRLEKGVYKIRFAEPVKVPPDCAAITIPRSTLLRCGAYILPGYWDPGYEGKGENLLVVENPHGLELEQGAKVAQLVFFRLLLPPEKLYRGSYYRENL